jgi:hypothetical protein
MFDTFDVQAFNTAGSRSRRKPAGASLFPEKTNCDQCKKGTAMLRSILITAAILYAAPAALAQELTAAQRDACMGDYEKYCKGTVPGGGRIIACLNKSADKLTAACKKVLAEAEKK